jgi:deoxyribodipyrimidine photo-lyase
MDNPVAVFWFRRDLRLEDNRGLYEALRSGLPVLPVFVFDKNILQSLSNRNDARVSFIHEAVSKLNTALLKHGSSLLVLFDTPLAAFQKLTEQFNVVQVFANHDYEPYAIDRDQKIAAWLAARNIRFNTFKDQVIFEKDEVLKPDGKPYTIFTPYSKKWKQNFSSKGNEYFPSEQNLEHVLKTDPFKLPSLKDIGFERIAIDFPSPVVDEQLIHNYHLTRNIPSINGTSRLSVHLRFGTLSTRKLAALATVGNEQWLNELIWREFFMMILFQFPQVVTRSFKPKYDKIPWRNNEREFEAWCDGRTGYPIVDAGMRELNETGFMHNRVRMITASFLTKHLLIDWRWGESYFAEKLLDFELSSNNGNWQWAAGCGCDAAPYFRIFNPAEQTKRFDPELVYIKKWLGGLKEYYLNPIVEHGEARKRALETYKKYLTE